MTKAPLNGIVVEPIIVVPERKGIITTSVGHGVGNEQEVLEELAISYVLDTDQRPWQLTLEAMSS